MLAEATFHNFTIVPDGTWTFAPGINVIIGENGTGKTHVLKALYSLLKPISGPNPALSRAELDGRLAEKLVRVFRPERLGRLVRRSRGKSSAAITLKLDRPAQSIAVEFGSGADAKVRTVIGPSHPLEATPVFFPTRELVTLAGWFAPLYDNYAVEFDETYRDTVSLLGGPARRGPRDARVDAIVAPLETLMGGRVMVDPSTGRFSLRTAGENLEMPLVAEGLRKLAMVARLVTTGALLEQGYLFWDEPETNLNPRILQAVAKTIALLADAGIQVFLATHSLYLLRELELLTSTDPALAAKTRFFALARSTSSAAEPVVLEQGPTLTDLDTIVSLDEELRQSDRFMLAQ